MRISDWSSDVCSSDLASDQRRLRETPESSRQSSPGVALRALPLGTGAATAWPFMIWRGSSEDASRPTPKLGSEECPRRSEEHTSELQSLMRISYAVFCLKKKKKPSSALNTKNRIESRHYYKRHK